MDLRVSDTLGCVQVVWGTGTPKDRDEVNRLIGESFECVMGECDI